jgi:hypothetical protein
MQWLHSKAGVRRAPIGVGTQRSRSIAKLPPKASESMIQVFTMQQPPADLLISITPGVRKLVEAAENLGP